MKNELYSEMYEKYKEGLSLSEVGKIYGVTRQSVYSGFKIRGYELRKKKLLSYKKFNNKKFTLSNTGYLRQTDEDRELMHRYVWRFYNGEIPKGFDIHHKNRDKMDNNIENLELISHSEHASKYNKNTSIKKKDKLKLLTSFSGIGAPETALKSLGIPHRVVSSGDIDKYVKKSYLAIHKTEEWHDDFTKLDYSKYEEIDLAVFGIPCQSFSIAGKGLGFEDTRGTLFFNVADFIKINQPKCFVLENVKGLVSHDSGRTFQTIIDVLSNGGGTVNGQMSLDVFEDGLGYHIYYQVLNTKDYGIPQNRERIFIVGFKEFTDFQFPKPFPLKLRLKDLLEDEVDEKYYLSDKMIEGFTGIDTNGISRTIRSGGKGSKTDKHNWDIIKEGYINQDTQASAVFDSVGVSPTLSAGTHGYAQGYVKVKSADEKVLMGAIRGRGENNQQQLEINETGNSNSLTTVQKDNVAIIGYTRDSKGNVSKRNIWNNAGTVHTSTGSGGNTDQFVLKNYRIRKLTPLECWRLQHFPDEYFYKAQKVNSATQLYKQAGNSISTNVLERLFEKILPKITNTNN